MISKFFINRPIFAAVISISIVIAGLISLKSLPIKEYPSIVPPQVSVTAYYPGANSETLLKTVAAPLEAAINGVKNMIYIKSTASPNGTLSISITFKIGTNPDMAKIDVNNRVQAALSKLPEEVRRYGIQVRERSPDLLEFIAFVSKGQKRNVTQVANYISINVIDELRRIPGVGDASIYGNKNYSMRIWIKPDKLAKYNLTIKDIVNAIRDQNNQYSAGRIAQMPMNNKPVYTYTITTKGRLKTVNEFKNIIIRANRDGSSLKLKDIADVQLSSEGYSIVGDYNNLPMVPVGVFLSPGANALSVAQAVNKTLKNLSKRFPKDITYYVPYNTTKFIKESIKEVIYTFLIAISLVVLIIYIFLGTLRATLIPVIAIPVSLIGSLAGFYIAGFSINLLTLFGLILAIGLVVDDAIVVIENVDRILSTNKDITTKEATIKAMNEITSPIIAIVLVLASVFIPASFIGGFSGKMYQQFAITIAISIFISGFVALTLTPALCALILKKDKLKPIWPVRKFNEFFNSLTKGFSKIVQTTIKLGVLSIIFFGIIIVSTFYISNITPKGLVPQEDKGIIFVISRLMPGYSLFKTEQVNKEINSLLLKNKNVAGVASVAGLDFMTGSIRTNASIIFVQLKDWSFRKLPQDSSFAITRQIRRQLFMYKKAMLFAANPPPIMGMSTTGGFEAYIQDRAGTNINTLAKYVNKIIKKANKQKKLMMVRTTLNVNVPEYKISIDTDKAKALNINLSSIFTTLQAMFGSYYIDDFNLYGKVYHVNMEALPSFRKSYKDYKYVFVRSNDGAMIPLNSIIKVKRVVGADILQRFNMFPAAQIIGQPRFGYSSGDAMKAIESVAKSILPKGYTISWYGTSYQENKLSKSGNKVFIYAIIFVFLILAALYESWTIPLAIIISVPFAIFGATIAIFLRHMESDIYFQVGIITLIGLSAKNAILMVEFALQKMKEGYTLIDATIEGAKIRFRPIIMTSMAFIAGTLPLALSSGAGANSRRIIGTTVVGGMLFATLIGIVFIPLFFYIIMKTRNIFIKRNQ